MDCYPRAFPRKALLVKDSNMRSMTEENSQNSILKSKFFVPIMGLFIAFMTIFQSRLSRPQWQKDWLLTIGVLALVLDFVVIGIILYMEEERKRVDSEGK